MIIDLCRKVIYHDPVNHCIIKGNKSDWDNLPRDKSLFYTPDNCGLPIGNLTSQVFANFYMNSFDHFIKHNLKIRYYGRYVDDCVIGNTGDGSLCDPNRRKSRCTQRSRKA